MRSLPALGLILALAGCTSTQLPAPSGPTPGAGGSLRDSLRQTWRYDATAAFGETPAVVIGDLAYVGTRRGEVHAVRLSSGKKAGMAQLFDAIETAPVVLGDRRVLVVPKSRQRPVALLLGGTRVWTAQERLAVSQPPVVTPDGIAIVTADRRAGTLDPSTGQSRGAWTARLDAPPALSAPDLAVWTSPGQVRRRDGTAAWTFALADPFVRFSTPVRAGNGGLAVGATDGLVRLLDDATGDLRWRRDLGDPVTAAPAYYDGRLYVGTLGRMFYVLDAATGAVLSRHRVGGRIKSTPLVYPGGVLVFAEPSHVYHFAPAAPEAPSPR